MSLEMIQNVFAVNTPLSSGERLVLLALAYCHNQHTNRCYPSTRTLSRMTGLTLRWTSRILRLLENKKMIIRQQIHKLHGIGWGYLITIPDQPREIIFAANGPSPYTNGANAKEQGSSRHETNGVTSPERVNLIPETDVVCAPQQMNYVPITGVLSTPEKEYININNINNKKREFQRFIKPTEEDIERYCTEHGYTDIIPLDFIDYYESNGLMIGRSPMKDWRRTVNRWHRNNIKKRNIGYRTAPGIVLHEDTNPNEHAYEF